MPLVNREIYTLFGSQSNLKASMSAGQRGIETDYEKNWGYSDYSGNYTVTANQKKWVDSAWEYQANSFGAVSLYGELNLRGNNIKDNFCTAGVPLSQAGTTGSVNFTATSILAALNEAKAAGVGTDYWIAVGATAIQASKMIFATKYADAFVASGINLGDSNNNRLSKYFTARSIVGALNELKVTTGWGEFTEAGTGDKYLRTTSDDRDYVDVRGAEILCSAFNISGTKSTTTGTSFSNVFEQTVNISEHCYHYLQYIDIEAGTIDGLFGLVRAVFTEAGGSVKPVYSIYRASEGNWVNQYTGKFNLYASTGFSASGARAIFSHDDGDIGGLTLYTANADNDVSPLSLINGTSLRVCETDVDVAPYTEITYNGITTASGDLTINAAQPSGCIELQVYGTSVLVIESDKVSLPSMVGSSTYPDNYSPLYINDDTGELFKYTGV